MRPVTARSVAEEIGRELNDLGRMAKSLQDVLTPFRTSPSEDGLQTLDLLTQRLLALADFTAAIAPAFPAVYPIGTEMAAAHIGLSDMARRLAGREHSGSPAESGSIELFDGSDMDGSEAT